MKFIKLGVVAEGGPINQVLAWRGQRLRPLVPQKSPHSCAGLLGTPTGRGPYDRRARLGRRPSSFSGVMDRVREQWHAIVSSRKLPIVVPWQRSGPPRHVLHFCYCCYTIGLGEVSWTRVGEEHDQSLSAR